MLLIQEYLLFPKIIRIKNFKFKKVVDGMFLTQEYLLFSRLFRIFFFNSRKLVDGLYRNIYWFPDYLGLFFFLI